MPRPALILHLVRHTEAVPLGGQVVRDADRPPSPRGEQDAEQMGKLLAALDPAVGQIITSPLLRARRTGELLGAQFAAAPPRRISDALVPGLRPKALLEELRALSRPSSCVLVGHEPDMGGLVLYLLTGRAQAGVAMPTGAIASLSVELSATRAEGKLHWLIAPETARLLRAPTASGR